MTRHPDVDTLLRSLDAADHQGAAGSPRARADLHRILSTNPAAADLHHPAPAPAAGRGRAPGKPVRRVAILGALVAAATAGLVILPALSGGDPAFATWTAAPAGMSAQDSAGAVADCRASNKRVGDGMYAGDVDAAAVAIAERRGVWTTVVLAGQDGFSALCITDNAMNLFGRGMIGSVGKPAGYVAPGARELAAVALGTGTMSAGDISMVAGSAGADIVGVSYKSRTREDVTATVSHGQFALWLPGDELRNASSDGVEVQVTYRDGTKGTTRLTL